MVGNNIYNELLSVSKQINTIIESLPVSTTEICDTPAKYSYLSSLTYESFTARLITERRQRAKSFGSELFADPAWDMLLDLFLAMLQKKRISISSACIASSLRYQRSFQTIYSAKFSHVSPRTARKSQRRVRIHHPSCSAESRNVANQVAQHQ